MARVLSLVSVVLLLSGTWGCRQSPPEKAPHLPLGEKSVDDWVAQLQTPDPVDPKMAPRNPSPQRMAAVAALEKMGPQAKKAAPVLLSLVDLYILGLAEKGGPRGLIPAGPLVSAISKIDTDGELFRGALVGTIQNGVSVRMSRERYRVYVNGLRATGPQALRSAVLRLAEILPEADELTVPRILEVLAFVG